MQTAISEIETQIRNQIVKAFAESEHDKLQLRTLSDDVDLWTVLKLDSLDVVEFSMRLEAIYGIEIPEADLDSLRTIRATVDYISRRIGQANELRRAS
jgi:acyl carrier protein